MITSNIQPQPFITKIIYAISLNNILGSILFSKLFTNEFMTRLDPTVFSNIGWISIILWGFAYLSISKHYSSVPYLLFVFFTEKMIYTFLWISWLIKNHGNLPRIMNQDLMTGLAFSSYGLGDLMAGIFFLWLALKFLKKIN